MFQCFVDQDSSFTIADLAGVAKSVDEPERAYRGYVAVDDLQFAPMGDGAEEACHGTANRRATSSRTFRNICERVNVALG